MQNVETFVSGPIPKFDFPRNCSWLARNVKRFLVHVARRLLNATGATASMQEWRVAEMRVDTGTVADRLMDARDILICNGSTDVWELPAVLVGPDILKEFERETRHLMDFYVPVKCGGRSMIYGGVRLIYVPWMRGGFVPITKELAAKIADGTQPPF